MLKSLALAGVCLLTLSGCASGMGGSPLTSQVLDNLEGCRRNYVLMVGGVLPPSGSLQITCEPQAKPAEPAPE